MTSRLSRPGAPSLRQAAGAGRRRDGRGCSRNTAPVTPAAEYLAKREGAWRAVPAVAGTQTKPPCVRYDLLGEHAGIDIRAMWPARP